MQLVGKFGRSLKRKIPAGIFLCGQVGLRYPIPSK